MIHQPKIRLYNFKKSFCPYVQDGSKQNTIRDRRKYMPMKGDILKLYYGLRSASTTLLRVEYCRDVKSIALTNKKVIIYQLVLPLEILEAAKQFPDNYRELPIDYIIEEPFDLDLFAWQDGFRPEGSSFENPAGAHELMMRFWSFTHDLNKNKNPVWAGDIIYWKASPEGARGGSLFEQYNKVHSITKKIIK